MFIDRTICMRESLDGTPYPHWLVESDEVFVTVARLLQIMWREGFCDKPDSWGLTVLPWRQIAMGPLDDYRNPVSRLSMTLVLRETIKLYPKRNPARFWLRIEPDYKDGGYGFYVFHPAKIRTDYVTCRWSNFLH